MVIVICPIVYHMAEEKWCMAQSEKMKAKVAVWILFFLKPVFKEILFGTERNNVSD